MSDVYVPFVYTEKVKQKGNFRIGVLREDIPFILLASSWLSHDFFLHAVSITCLVFSFWCIYELGYYENDRVAEKFEHDGVLSKEYGIFSRQMRSLLPWGWAIALAMPGLALLQLIPPSPVDLQATGLAFGHSLSAWLGLLVCMRLTFWCYNYVDKKTRMWLYPLLQFYRYFSCVIITTTNTIGAMLLSAQILSRWFAYLVYRYSEGNWPSLSVPLIRWIILLFLLGGIAIGNQGVDYLVTWQAVAIILYCAFKARRQFWELIGHVQPIKSKQGRKA